MPQGLGYSALALHGDLDQMERDHALVQFAGKCCTVLVATDVAARGLDVAELPMVINVEVMYHHLLMLLWQCCYSPSAPAAPSQYS